MIRSEIVDLFRVDEEEELLANELHGFQMCREWRTEHGNAGAQILVIPTG